jgi:hypothetical protein
MLGASTLSADMGSDAVDLIAFVADDNDTILEPVARNDASVVIEGPEVDLAAERPR